MRLGGWRAITILGGLFVTLAVASTGAWLTHIATSSREREMLRNAGLGLAFADSLETSLRGRSPASISEAEAVAALYLERLRLGLGSPFRLIDQALRDPAVGPVGAIELAEAMLARTVTGEAYQSRPAALE